MRSKKEIEEEIKKESIRASAVFKQHMVQMKLDGNEMYLRMYNKIQDRIIALKWVLDED